MFSRAGVRTSRKKNQPSESRQLQCRQDYLMSSECPMTKINIEHTELELNIFNERICLRLYVFRRRWCMMITLNNNSSQWNSRECAVHVFFGTCRPYSALDIQQFIPAPALRINPIYRRLKRLKVTTIWTNQWSRMVQKWSPDELLEVLVVSGCIWMEPYGGPGLLSLLSLSLWGYESSLWTGQHGVGKFGG